MSLLARPRAAAALALAFAIVATLVAAGGIFSVLSHAVWRRIREFGIRAAMEAHPRQLGRLVAPGPAGHARQSGRAAARGVVSRWRGRLQPARAG
jgi:hypothetical protein